MKPNLFIISGPNGEGKTTASYTILPEMLNCREFVNADEIAKGISPFQPETAAIEAGRYMLKKIKEHVHHRTSFAFETTLSTRSYINLIKEAKENHFDVTLIFFWLNSPELAIERVKTRVKEGGHNIPFETVRRRYYSGIRNLFRIYMPAVDYWMIINNSEKPFCLIAEGSETEIKINEKKYWSVIKKICYEK